MSSETRDDDNIRLQAEQHPLVAREFDTIRAYCLSLMHRKAYRFAAELAEDAMVLDLGCNHGYGSALLAPKAREVVGIDVSDQAIREAQSSNWAPNLRFQTCDGRTMPFEDDTFDLITGFQIVEHIDGVVPYLREVERVAKSGGTVILTTPNRAIRLDPGMEPCNPFHVQEFTAEDLRETLSGVFDEVRVQGLFAVPEIYDVEYGRVQRARKKARRGRLQKRAREAIKSVASIPFADLVRKRRRRSGARFAELERFMAKYSEKDLHYSNENLDRALDLMAVCRAK
jgi:SAM-dependent methyltransferase